MNLNWIMSNKNTVMHGRVSALATCTATVHSNIYNHIILSLNYYIVVLNMLMVAQHHNTKFIFLTLFNYLCFSCTSNSYTDL